MTLKIKPDKNNVTEVDYHRGTHDISIYRENGEHRYTMTNASLQRIDRVLSDYFYLDGHGLFVLGYKPKLTP